MHQTDVSSVHICDKRESEKKRPRSQSPADALRGNSTHTRRSVDARAARTMFRQIFADMVYTQTERGLVYGRYGGGAKVIQFRFPPRDSRQCIERALPNVSSFLRHPSALQDVFTIRWTGPIPSPHDIKELTADLAAMLTHPTCTALFTNAFTQDAYRSTLRPIRCARDLCTAIKETLLNQSTELVLFPQPSGPCTRCHDASCHTDRLLVCRNAFCKHTTHLRCLPTDLQQRIEAVCMCAFFHRRSNMHGWGDLCAVGVCAIPMRAMHASFANECDTASDPAPRRSLLLSRDRGPSRRDAPECIADSDPRCIHQMQKDHRASSPRYQSHFDLHSHTRDFSDVSLHV